MIPPWLVFVESNTSGTGRLFVRAAVREGARPILLTADPARYGYVAEEALDVLEVDTQDGAALLAACRRLAAEAPLAGLTSSSEYFVATAAALARRLGLPGPLPAAVRTCRDKQALRRRLQAAGVGIPAFRPASSVKAAVAAARSIGFPVVVKPVSGTGSAGVRLCKAAEAVAAHAGALLRQRRNERGMPLPRRILVEALADGPEYSVETFGSAVVGITRKHLGPLPFFVEVGHDFPAALSDAARARIEQEVRRALEALALGWGPAHFELRLTAEGPRIIEVNPRLAGGYIPELVRLAFGLDLIGETVRLALGRAVRLERPLVRFASIRFLLAPRAGTLAGVEGLEAARQVEGVAEAQLYTRPGNRVRRGGDFRDRLGHVMAAGPTPEAAHAAVEQAHAAIRLTVQPDPTMAAEEA